MEFQAFYNLTFVALVGFAGWLLRKALMEIEELKSKIVGKDAYHKLTDTVTLHGQSIARLDAQYDGVDARLERIEAKIDRMLEDRA